MIMTATASAAGGRLRQGSKFVPQRPREEDAIKGYINTEMSGSQPMGTAFLVVTGPVSRNRQVKHADKGILQTLEERLVER